MVALAARMRFVYILNIIVTSYLAFMHLSDPRAAARQMWGGATTTLALPMLGGWWAAVALLSALGLSSPLKYSPVMLMQITYKVAFLSTAILPLVAQRRYSAFPVAPTAVFASYLPLLLACAPWGYWLGREGPDAATYPKRE